MSSESREMTSKPMIRYEISGAFSGTVLGILESDVQGLEDERMGLMIVFRRLPVAAGGAQPEPDFDGELTTETALRTLEDLRNISHDDLDDHYLEPCPDCGGKQYYKRNVPRGRRVIHCINCSAPSPEATVPAAGTRDGGNEIGPVVELLNSLKVIDRSQRYTECRSDVLTLYMYELARLREGNPIDCCPGLAPAHERQIFYGNSLCAKCDTPLYGKKAFAVPTKGTTPGKMIVCEKCAHPPTLPAAQVELPKLDADIEERIQRLDSLDAIEKTNLAEEVLDNREEQLLAQIQINREQGERIARLQSELRSKNNAE